MKLRLAWLLAALGIGGVAGVAGAGCNIVLGLDAYKNCPEQVSCPGSGGMSGASTATSTDASTAASTATSTATSTAASTAASTGAGGSPTHCSTPLDCPAGGPCSTAECTGGVCGLNEVADGTACNEATGSCKTGVCVCDAANLCGGVCVDRTTDAANCGTCGNACAATISCVAGACACPAGQPTACPHACVDTTTDAANCGSCGHGCQGGTCKGSACQPVTLYSGQADPFSIAVDANNVYWTNGGSVWSGPIGGGAASQLASGNQLWSIAVDATSVYWTDYNGGSVAKAPIGGGGTTVLAPGQQFPTGLAVNATSVYWTTGAGSGYKIMQVALGGGTATQPGSGQGVSNGVALDATSFYFTAEHGEVTKAPLGGGVATQIAFGQASPEAIAVDATNVYWINAGTFANNFTDGAVMTASIDGGPVTTLASGQLVASGTTFAYFIALDTTSVYWTLPGLISNNYTDGAVVKVAKTGGATTTVAPGQVQPRGIAVDATSVYWVDQAGGTVMKLAK